MAKTDNLGDFLADIANAIREVRNETGSILAQDFAAKIREMTYNPGPVTPEIGYYNFEVVNNYNSVDISYENQSGATSTSNENYTDYIKAGSTVYIGDQNQSATDQGLDYTGLSEEYEVKYGEQEDIYTYWYEVIGDVTITGY